MRKTLGCPAARFPPPVTHETQYFADPFDGSPGRAALAEAIPPADQ